jgi:hypothetical protein
MSQPTPSPQPESDSTPGEPQLDEAVADEVGVPLNRADRRARAKGGNPSHVGPQAGRSDQRRGQRSHTKRRLG